VFFNLRSRLVRIMAKVKEGRQRKEKAAKTPAEEKSRAEMTDEEKEEERRLEELEAAMTDAKVPAWVQRPSDTAWTDTERPLVPTLASVRRVAINYAFVALTRGDTTVAKQLFQSIGLSAVRCMEEAMLYTCRPSLRQNLLATLQDCGWTSSPEIVRS
jgi:hypothetical protein